MQEIADKLIKTEEAARALGLNSKTLRSYARRGDGPLPVVRIGRTVRYRISDVNALIAGGGVPSTPKRGPGRPRKGSGRSDTHDV